MDSRASGAIGGAAQGAAAGAAFGPYGAAIGGIIGGIGGFLSGGGEDEAEKLAERQARLIELTTQENLRQMTKTMGQEQGFATAAAAASNVQMSGSSLRFKTALQQESLKEMSWARTEGNLKAELARAGGAAAASKIESAGIASMMGGLSSAAGAGLFGSYTKTGGYKWDPWSNA